MVQSTIKIINHTSASMKELDAESVDLIVTSPPYPMIQMWDECFSEQNTEVKDALEREEWRKAFLAMHSTLNTIWHECDRVLKKNGFVCINIGDATRTCGDMFQLFSNHTKIISTFEEMGYSVLPDIHWRKETTAPNKFMGSGMYPAGAYVTYEHEYILIFRKGGKRVFKSKEKDARRQSAYFWEERNNWFSDVWNIKGTSQTIKNSDTRERSAAFPFEIPYRLVNMYSVYGDTVLDPFGGLSTTALSCIASNRNCICYDTDTVLCDLGTKQLENSKDYANAIVNNRIKNHMAFLSTLPAEKYIKCYINKEHGFKVKTRQEIDILLYKISTIAKNNQREFVVTYEKNEKAQ